LAEFTSIHGNEVKFATIAKNLQKYAKGNLKEMLPPHPEQIK
jgi:hypothetical protein